MKTNKLFLVFLGLFLTAMLIAVSLSYNHDQTGEQDFTASLAVPPEKPLERSSASILFVGDIMLDRGVKYYSEKSAGENANDFVFEKIRQMLLGYNIVAANLEGPITDNDSVSITAKMEAPQSYFFTFDPSWATTLFENNIRLVCLGNNHILNFGGMGLLSTKNYLKEAGVEYFGAPDQPRSALLDINGIKISVISYNEFSAYGKIEEKLSIEEIKRAREISDVVIVYSHWGVEYEPDPPDAVTRTAHKFIDAGADLIIGSHPHVVQSMEVYKEKRIYYSLGNFIFDQYFSEETKKGLGVGLKIEKTGETIELGFEEISFYTQENGQTIISY